jgi:hypothetical protein
MFDAFIIQQIIQDEEERRRRDSDRPRLEVPRPDYEPQPEAGQAREDSAGEERGVVIIGQDDDDVL